MCLSVCAVSAVSEYDDNSHLPTLRLGHLLFNSLLTRCVSCALVCAAFVLVGVMFTISVNPLK
jgi:hypothetical protein